MCIYLFPCTRTPNRNPEDQFPSTRVFNRTTCTIHSGYTSKRKVLWSFWISSSYTYGFRVLIDILFTMSTKTVAIKFWFPCFGIVVKIQESVNWLNWSIFPGGTREAVCFLCDNFTRFSTFPSNEIFLDSQQSVLLSEIFFIWNYLWWCICYSSLSQCSWDLL